jgi:hypothetical protein
MSQAISPSTAQPYGLARVCRVWGLARSTVYSERPVLCRYWFACGMCLLCVVLLT